MRRMPLIAIYGPLLGWFLLLSAGFTGQILLSLYGSGFCYLLGALGILVGQQRWREENQVGKGKKGTAPRDLVKATAKPATPNWFKSATLGYFLLLVAFLLLFFAPSSQTWTVIIQVNMLLGTLLAALGAWLSSPTLFR